MFIKIMTAINVTFQNFVNQVLKKGSIEQAIERAEQKYSLKAYKITEIDEVQAVRLYESIYLKFYKGHPQLISTNWYQNELRIFIWTLACYIFLHDLTIPCLDSPDWSFFAKLFDKKDPRLFEYQCHAICSDFKNKTWNNEEQQLLTKIMSSKQGTTKWNEVSKELFQLSNKQYFRTAKQCRQRWNNHLDPSKIKGFWKPEQCLLMLQYVREHGKKWANLVRIFNKTRNQHSIKNKFNSIIKKQRKLHPSLQQNEIYDQIIARIRKSIENMAILDNEDISYDFDQYVDFDIEEKPLIQAEPSCHQITRNFQKILNGFNRKDAELNQKLYIKHDEKSSTTMPDYQFNTISTRMNFIGQTLYDQRQKLHREVRLDQSRQIPQSYQKATSGKFLNKWPEINHQFYCRNSNILYPILYNSMRPCTQVVNFNSYSINPQYNNE